MLLCNKKKDQSPNLKIRFPKKDQHIFKPFFMPLIVFIKTVGISQKILQTLLDICTGRKSTHTVQFVVFPP